MGVWGNCIQTLSKCEKTKQKRRIPWFTTTKLGDEQSAKLVLLAKVWFTEQISLHQRYIYTLSAQEVRKIPYHATQRLCRTASNKFNVSRRWDCRLDVFGIGEFDVFGWETNIGAHMVQIQTRISWVYNYKWAATLVDVNKKESHHLCTSLLTSTLAFHLLLTVSVGWKLCLDVYKTKCAGFCAVGRLLRSSAIGQDRQKQTTSAIPVQVIMQWNATAF